jgi:pyruvate/2-oxoglutarate dehydrogenase complex dihydrolipoamide dehydrogenase (E3) component
MAKVRQRRRDMVDGLIALHLQNYKASGAEPIGAEAGEVAAAVQTAILAGLPYTGLRDAILTHPTMAEGLGPLFSNVPPRSAR